MFLVLFHFRGLEFFLKEVSESLNVISEKAMTAKINLKKDTLLVVGNLWPLGQILEVKPNRTDGLLMNRVKLKTKSTCPGTSHEKIVLLDAPRHHESG